MYENKADEFWTDTVPALAKLQFFAVIAITLLAALLGTVGITHVIAILLSYLVRLVMGGRDA